ncbi:MAG: hypothetical protein JNN32_14475 [Flavobacteriales bacterium]|nr:hypothetical protein [Flavobacteriales bacterium]
MRNTTFLILGSLLLVIASCKKDDDTPPPTGGGGGNGGGGTNGNGLVTAWSPLKPYPDDVITLSGGPFNTNAAQNAVSALGDAFTIVSVSATQLQVRPPADFAPTSGGFSNLYIQSGNSYDTIPYLYWKRPMDLRTLEDNVDQNFFGSPARAGDSVVFNASGCTLNGMSMSLNGQSIPGPFAVDSAYYCTIGFRIPLSFGSGTDESTLTNAMLSATNADGRTDTLTIAFAPTPDMRINDLVLLGGGSTFSISQMNSNGQVLNFIVEGRYLHSTTPWTLTGPSPANGTLGVSGYPNEAPLVVNPVSMQPGAYNLSVPGIGNNYSFTFTP